MPYYGDKDELEKLRKHRYCATCGEWLAIWYEPDTKRSYLACKDYQRTYHEGITRHNKVNEKYMAEVKELYQMDSKALMVMNETQMLQRVDMAKFPQEMTVADKRLLAQVALTYGFDPLMGEVTIYQGRPWVSIDGRYRKAQETGRFDGIETRPANKQERIDWSIPDDDYFFRAEVFVKGTSRPFVGWGRVFAAETTGGKGFKPVEKNPQRMAEKRAEAQALRKAFHIPLPSTEDIGNPEVDIDGIGKVTVATGEIIESTAIKKPAEQSPTPTPEVAQIQGVEQKQTGLEGMPEFKSAGDLISYANKKLQKPIAEIYKMLGVKSTSEIHDLPVAYKVLFG